MSLAIKCYPKGVYGENTYLIEDEATGYKAIIDPGYYDMEVRMDIANNIYLKYVLLTHGHHDHYFAANKYLQEYSSVKFCAPDKKDISLERASALIRQTGSKRAISLLSVRQS